MFNNILRPVATSLIVLMAISLLLMRTNTVTDEWSNDELDYALRVATQDATAVMMDHNFLFGIDEEESDFDIDLDYAYKQFESSFFRNIGSTVSENTVNKMSVALVGYAGYRYAYGMYGSGATTTPFPYSYYSDTDNCIYEFTLGDKVFQTKLSTMTETTLLLSSLPENYFSTAVTNENFRTITVMSAITDFLNIFFSDGRNITAVNAGSGLRFDLGTVDYAEDDNTIMTKLSGVIDGPSFFAVVDCYDSRVDRVVRLFSLGAAEFKSNIERDIDHIRSFTVTEENRAAVGYTGAVGENLVIPATFAGGGNGTEAGVTYKVTAIDKGAFRDCHNLVSVTIPASVTNIRPTAFIDCKNLTTLNVDELNTAYESVNGILFTKGLGKLVQYPAGKPGASYTAPDATTAIGQYAFHRCQNLRSVDISANVIDVEDHAFRNSRNISSVALSAKCRKIGVVSFSGCSDLDSITFPQNIRSIGASAFTNCVKLVAVEIPSKVNYIGTQAFSGCSALTAINVDAANNSYASIDGVLFKKNISALIQYPAGKSGDSYAIPSSVTTIGATAFVGCKLTNVNIPANIATIQNQAFAYCSRLTDITFPETKVRWDAVAKETDWNINAGNYTVHCADCDITNEMKYFAVTSSNRASIGYTGAANEHLVIPATFIGSESNGCDIGREYKVTNIDGSAFSNCTNLTSVTIPSTVTSVKYQAFYHCANLTNIVFTGTKSQWQSVTKGEYWDVGTGNYVVHCADGDIPKT